MKILFIGDIVGKSGRDIVSSLLFTLKKENNIDLVIANGENSAHGKGITSKIYNQLLEIGVDYITMGNHTFSKKELFDHIDNMDRLIVPDNHKDKKGKSYRIIKQNNMNICICNVLGDVLIGETISSPYASMDKILDQTKDRNVDIYFVDYHGETTAEKRLFAEFYKNKIDVLVGTHTHVQTADERMIGDMAFITDTGMCGVYDSIIGRDIEESIQAKVLGMSTHFKVATGESQFNGVIISINDSVKKVESIERIQIRP